MSHKQSGKNRQATTATKARVPAPPPATPETKPRSPRLTEEKIIKLVDEIIQHDEDSRASALVDLIHGISYEDDRLDRDNFALVASRRAYTKTMEFSRSALNFMDRATGQDATGATEQPD